MDFLIRSNESHLNFALFGNFVLKFKNLLPHAIGNHTRIKDILRKALCLELGLIQLGGIKIACALFISNSCTRIWGGFHGLQLPSRDSISSFFNPCHQAF